ncbi:A24 family peptidase [Sphingomonas sp. SUN019]|uniref:prepilin peptidase n=1 Tax=Sphingomonas sp. SUN019 TaxID=2937788 RepID=UPI00216441BB|nr:A24 family peptidase [Sphingomonas sp. SUN019]UVO52357.1 A24 family peptidase [Sphingomonas sp. SUN019]
MPDAMWPVALAIFGAIVGSFLATIVVRWPQGRSVLRGRSACDECGRTLGAAELVPLVSAAMSRGRCRTCGARINPTHWRIEGGAALIGLAAGFVAPGVEGLAGAAFGWVLLTLAAIDAAEMWLPDELTATLALGGLAAGLFGLPPGLEDRLIGGIAGFASLWLIAFGYRRLRGHDGMGGGDPKLYGAIGLWLGWRMLPAVLLIAALIGLGYALFERFRGRAVAGDTALPFGTFLAIAAYPAWLVMVSAGG